MHSQSLVEERRAATDEEIKTLPHVVDTIPPIIWVALVASATERFTFYAVKTPWQNYVQNPSNSAAVPGALGLGQVTATTISNAFAFLTFLSPVPFAILADVWLGRFKTLCISFSLGSIGCLVIFVTSFPFVMKESVKIFGLALGMIFLGLGTGGVKATVSPFIGDQYIDTPPQLVIRRNGERVIADRNMTLQYIYNVLYWFTNIASLSLIASTYLEKEVGFWAAYLLPLISIWCAVPLMLLWNKSFIKIPPQGNVLTQASKLIMCSVRERFHLDAAIPAFQFERYGRNVEWDDRFVFEMRRGLMACKVMACFILFNLCLNQISNNLVSQAGQMRLSGIPNDTIQALNSVACVLLGPIIQKIIFPRLRRMGVRFGPIARMATAFVAMSFSMAFAAIVQKLIYSSGPCYQYPLTCPGSDNGNTPNDISVWVQTPTYFLLACAEILGVVSLYEYSYSQAPRNLRSLVQAIGQISSAIGAALGIAISPLAVDPKILYMYVGLAVVMAIIAPVFWLFFRKQDDFGALPNDSGSPRPEPRQSGRRSHEGQGVKAAPGNEG
ncbi:POT family-domain-containing protein [Xylaria grammica]|nr:POT family-domain-containing protein [Xylaria grammica]